MPQKIIIVHHQLTISDQFHPTFSLIVHVIYEFPLKVNPITVESELFRKRSSSLPRILPPILDGQEDDGEQDNNYQAAGKLAALKQMDQTSNLIVREMQKFVCRHSSDVSQVLPLPLPANSR